MAGDLILILGGARSGKSRHAEALAARLGERVLYVATAEAGDEEMRARIAAHRARRPPEWETLEAPLGVGAALLAHPTAAHADVILLDCLTLLVSNILLAGGEEEPDAEAVWPRVQAEVEGLLAAHRRLPGHLLIVSNEVGMGLVPPYPLGRTYRDCLGQANQVLARAAERVILMIAGIPMKVVGCNE